VKKAKYKKINNFFWCRVRGFKTLIHNFFIIQFNNIILLSVAVAAFYYWDKNFSFTSINLEELNWTISTLKQESVGLSQVEEDSMCCEPLQN